VRRLDEECPHQVVRPWRQLGTDDEVMAFRVKRVASSYVRDGDAAFVRYAPILINAGLGKGIGRAASNRRDHAALASAPSVGRRRQPGDPV